MTATKRLGIWMDHASGHLTEFTTDPLKTRTIHSKFTHEEKEHGLQKNENVMHNKEQQQESAFYQSLADAMKEYDEVVLFGPTKAKSELFNLLKKDHHFDKIKITVEQADKMTEGQQHAFVKDFFLHKL